jgi:hypothetical protein
MKSLKNVLAALAFVFASAAAFATLGNSNSAIDPITAYKMEIEPCDTEVQCDVNFTGISCNNYRTNPETCSGTLPQNLWEQ